ncbi:MAG: HAD-IC family P-type ATPase [Anaerolineae bacterium]|nr:HAD-IC family P-type ATPase [Anaerolineae bacterium]
MSDLPPSLTGLTDQAAAERRQRGQGNNVRIQTGRTYAEILRQNIFNLINVILFTIGAVMVAIGRVSDALVSVSLIFFNAVIGIFQEARAKRQLDQIALLTRPKVTLLRAGHLRPADPAEIVVGDVILCDPGDQIVVDGTVLQGRVEVDESLLTGESDLIPKTTGDTLLSGSFAVNGRAYYEATKVGAASYASQLTAQARQFRLQKTPLQREVDLVIRFLLLLALCLGFLMLVAALLEALPFVRGVQRAAVIAGLVPNGLFFMVIVAYALGALRIVNRGALVQQSNAVESLSNVSVLCMDKTGTLTANRIYYQALRPIGMDEALVTRLLADFAASATVTNKTTAALIAALPGHKHTPVDEVPFSSARKWSALASTDRDLYGVYVLGALEMLQPCLPAGGEWLATVREWSESGLRVLVFAHNPAVTTLHNAAGTPTLPLLTPLAVVSFGDELRPHLRETLLGFLNAGVELKVISGDNPATVRALAQQAGFPGSIQAVSGTELEGLSESELEEVAARNTIFGRITPEQKEKLVEALKRRGQYVAMIGDGVNDVLSLKKANLGVAMHSGSAATRGVADMILLNDSFGALPPAFLEGQRIINGMQDILRLFLTRAMYVSLLILAIAMVGIGFPLLPKHNTLMTFVTVAIPTFMLALWAKPGKLRRTSLVATLMHFVFPAALSIMVFGLLVYVGTVIVVQSGLDSATITEDDIRAFQDFAGVTYQMTPDQAGLERTFLTAQTALTVFTTFAGLVLLIFVEPPSHWWVGGDVYSGELRPTLLALLLMVVFLVIMNYTPFRRFFELVAMPLSAYIGILGMVVLWALTLRAAWRGRWLERFLNIAPLRPEINLAPDAAPRASLVQEQVKAITLQ